MGKPFGFISKLLGSKSSERPSARTASPPAPAKKSNEITPELQEILETIPLLERMEKVLLLIGKAVEVARLQAQITEQMQDQVSEQQKEFFLRQLLKIIQKELGIAMKGASAAVQEKIFGNMSNRAADMIKEDMEFMGPIRLRNVEEAQQRIVGVIRRLEESGELTVSRGGEEVMNV